MRVFGAIVQISSLSVFSFWVQLALSHAVASQLISHDRTRHILQAFQQSPEKALGHFGIPSRLNQDVEHNAVLVHSAPQIMLHTLEPDERLIKIPLIRHWTKPSRGSRVGIVTLTSAGRLEFTSGNVERITQPAERRSPAARC
jgi:hypothetical protein